MGRPKKYSPVFPGTVKPARPGVYQRWFGGWVFARWTGTYWRTPTGSYGASIFQPPKTTIKWRGLAKKP